MTPGSIFEKKMTDDDKLSLHRFVETTFHLVERGDK
jgi:hypothetical protein